MNIANKIFYITPTHKYCVIIKKSFALLKIIFSSHISILRVTQKYMLQTFINTYKMRYFVENKAWISVLFSLYFFLRIIQKINEC